MSTTTNRKTTIRDTASVTVKKPVNGRVQRRKSNVPRQKLATKVSGFTVDRRVMKAAREAMLPFQKIVPVSPTEVLVVNRR